jgi:circadian clock protein KaiB
MNLASNIATNRPASFRFQLFVAGDAQNSVHAIANLSALCRAHLPSRHEIEIVDVFKEPRRALAEGIFMTPTLVRVSPAPVRRIVGTLSQTQVVLEALGLAQEAVAA